MGCTCLPFCNVEFIPTPLAELAVPTAVAHTRLRLPPFNCIAMHRPKVQTSHHINHNPQSDALKLWRFVTIPTKSTPAHDGSFFPDRTRQYTMRTCKQCSTQHLLLIFSPRIIAAAAAAYNVACAWVDYAHTLRPSCLPLQPNPAANGPKYPIPTEKDRAWVAVPYQQHQPWPPDETVQGYDRSTGTS